MVSEYQEEDNHGFMLLKRARKISLCLLRNRMIIRVLNIMCFKEQTGVLAKDFFSSVCSIFVFKTNWFFFFFWVRNLAILYDKIGEAVWFRHFVQGFLVLRSWVCSIFVDEQGVFWKPFPPLMFLWFCSSFRETLFLRWRCFLSFESLSVCLLWFLFGLCVFLLF